MRACLSVFACLSVGCFANQPIAESQSLDGDALEAKLTDFVNYRNNVTFTLDEFISLVRDLPEDNYDRNVRSFLEPCVKRLGKDLVLPVQQWLTANQRKNCHRAFELIGFFATLNIPFEPVPFRNLALDGMKEADHPTHYFAGVFLALHLTHSGPKGLKHFEELLADRGVASTFGYQAFAFTGAADGFHSVSGSSWKLIADALILKPWHDFRDERFRAKKMFLNLVRGMQTQLHLEDLESYDDLKDMWIKYRNYVFLRRFGAPPVTVLKVDMAAFEERKPVDPDTDMPK